MPTICPIILEISPATPFNTTKIIPITNEIIVTMTEMVQAHPLPFKRPHATIKLTIASAIRTLPIIGKYPLNTDRILFAFLISVLLRFEDRLSSKLLDVSLILYWLISGPSITKAIPPIKVRMPPIIVSIAIIVTPIGRFRSACKLIDAYL